MNTEKFRWNDRLAAVYHELPADRSYRGSPEGQMGIFNRNVAPADLPS